MKHLPSSPIAVTPGSVLREEIENGLGISQDRLAKAIRVSRLTINEIVNEKRTVTAEMALKLAKALGTDPEFWLNLQRGMDWQKRPKGAVISAKSRSCEKGLNILDPVANPAQRRAAG